MAEVNATMKTDTPRTNALTKARMWAENDGQFVLVRNEFAMRKPEYWNYIYNIAPKEHPVERTWFNLRFDPESKAPIGKQVVIPACKAGERYSEPVTFPDVIPELVRSPNNYEVTTKGTRSDFLIGDLLNPDDASMTWDKYRAPNASNSINTGTSLYDWGVWYSRNSPPTEREIKVATDHFVAKCQMLIREANKFAQSPKWIDYIDDNHRMAARYVGEEFSWCGTFAPKVDCEFCGAKINAKSVLCKECSAVRDWPAAIRAGLRTKQQAIDAGALEPEPEKKARKAS
jgi:hypothetical protein